MCVSKQVSKQRIKIKCYYVFYRNEIEENENEL